jgi:ligand-binding SRPBCC domain-containing protein
VQLRFEQLVSIPRQKLFEFHMDPANLAILLEGWRCFELRGHTGSIRPGSRVQLRQRVGPLSFDLEFVHFVLEPPECFGERQVRGPFARFEHIHEFHEDSGGTRIVDRIDFALPWYLGGRLADRLFARPELVRFFEFRRKAYGRLLQDGRLS